MSLTLVIVVVVVLIVLWVVSIFNRLVRLKNQTDEAWSDIDVQLKRRYDLIPNLVETVKGYATHEKSLLENVTKARTEAMGAKSFEDRAAKENALSETLKSLFAVAENYPTLKANENFAKLQDELAGTEDKIEASRRFYNGNVRDFNIAIETFPSSIVAGMFHYAKRQLFQLAEKAESEPIKVDFKN